MKPRIRTFVLNHSATQKSALRELSAVKISDGMEIILRPHVKSKTNEQRGFFHLLCKTLGDETGYTLGEIKELVKCEVLGTQLVEIGGCKREIPVSSEAQKRINYSELIEGIYRIAANAGVLLPLSRFQ